jgi:hypothetical protein
MRKLATHCSKFYKKSGQKISFKHQGLRRARRGF